MHSHKVHTTNGLNGIQKSKLFFQPKMAMNQYNDINSDKKVLRRKEVNNDVMPFNVPAENYIN